MRRNNPKHSLTNPENELSQKEKAILLIVAGLGALGLGYAIKEKNDNNVSCDVQEVIVQNGDTVWGLSGSTVARSDKTRDLNPEADLSHLQPGEHLLVCKKPPGLPEISVVTEAHSSSR